jgi:hypothetical protein
MRTKERMQFFRNKFNLLIVIFIFLILLSIFVFGNPKVLTFFYTIYFRNQPDNVHISVLIPDTLIYNFTDIITYRSLNDLALVRQHNSNFCVPATIYMVENHFFGVSKFAEVCYFSNESGYLDYLYEIFEQIVVPNPFGRVRGSSMVLAGYHLENRGLNTSIIVYNNDLKEILLYLESKQIPSIISLQTTNLFMGHAIVFTGFDLDKEIVSLLDPIDPNKKSLTYEEFSSLLTFYSVNAYNYMIIANDQIDIERWYFCPNCNHGIVVDDLIIDYIIGLICPSCTIFSYTPEYFDRESI